MAPPSAAFRAHPRSSRGRERRTRTGTAPARPATELPPSPQYRLGGFERVDDLAGVLDDALDEEVEAGAPAAAATEVGEQADDALLARIRAHERVEHADLARGAVVDRGADRKSTRLNSSHLGISYAVFCLKKKK